MFNKKPEDTLEEIQARQARAIAEVNRTLYSAIEIDRRMMVANVRKAYFDAYRTAGFNEFQSLELAFRAI